MESTESAEVTAIIERNIYEPEKRWVFCPNCEEFLFKYDVTPENQEILKFPAKCHHCGQVVVVEI